jgi:hypothetical protein
MKKFLTIALAIVLVAMVAVPAMATDVSFSGSYRVQGWWTEGLDLDARSANDAAMDHRFRLQTKFGINDMLSVTTRFDAMDGVYWGGVGASATSPGGANFINWDRTWMTINAGEYGKFDVGRMAGGTWGTSFVDNEVNADRVKWTYAGVENFTFLLIYEAAAERDGGSYAAGTRNTYITGQQSDQDSTTYYAAFVYKGFEGMSTGFLYGFNNNQTAPATHATLNVFIPYFSGNWGPLHAEGELRWNYGTRDNDVGADIDVNGYAWNLQGAYDFGPAKINAGTAFMSGEDLDATQVTAFAGFGGDWAYPLMILAGNDGPWSGNLGGATANLSGGNYGGGAFMWWIGASFAPIETLTLGANFGMSTADETENIINPRTGIRGDVDDDQGSELDLILDWKIADNLTYHAVLGWYFNGDYWRDAGNIPVAQFDDCTAFFNQLVMTF